MRKIVIQGTPVAGVLLFFLAAACFAAQYSRVEYVIDGDTLVLAGGDHVRLIGVNAPEQERDEAPAQPYSLEAKLALSELVLGARVSLQDGSEKRDRYGRRLSHVFLEDGRNVQEELLHRGYAVAIAIPPNTDHLDRYVAVENEARAAGRGLWGDPFFNVNRVRELDGWPGGFQLLRGEVSSVSESRKNVRLTLDQKLVVLVSHDAWKTYWNSLEPATFLGRHFEVRGWINPRRDPPMMRIHHPFALRETRS